MTNPQGAQGGSDQAEAIASRLPVGKRVLFSVVIVCGFFLALELTVRVGAYFLYHRSPYFLFYGIKSWMADAHTEGHTVAREGYFKFPPSRILHQYGMFQQPTPIRIDSLGFRGPDFSRAKPEGTLRIVCLGESSTFGFFDRDDFTYPAILQRLFAERSGRETPRVEVVNAGIPHVNSDNIRAMLEGEILGYSPDVVTIYAGYNDTSPMDQNSLETSLRWVHEHFASYVALKHLVSVLGGPQLYSRWASFVPSATPEYVNRQIALHVARYDRNLRHIYGLAQRRGAHVVFIRQPMIPGYHKGSADLAKSYQQRVSEARAMLARTGRLSGENTSLLVHAALMGVLDRLADEYHAPVVDNISIVDAHPEYYASYVHLTEEGNRALAEAIYQAVAPLL